ncbi:hypothetical protein ACSU64_04540 [Bacillaceae bacterium C204]|uniref:hypothetical protein n=1 Tax=Neobacillus sp. 204 TaxID=3383351 RepID=UPI00397B6089
MEEPLNKILSELQYLDTGQKELKRCTCNLEKGHKELISCIDNVEKGQKELLNRTENLNKGQELLISGQQEIKDLIEQTASLMTENFTTIRKDIKALYSKKSKK